MRKGFTLIEVLIVVSIISILLVIFMVNSKDYTVQADLRKQQLNSKLLESSIKQHKLDNEEMPFGAKITKEISNETKKIIEYQLKNNPGVTYDDVKDSFYILDKKKIQAYTKGKMDDLDRYFSSDSKALEGMVFTYDTLKTKNDGTYSGSYVLLEAEEGGNEVKPPEPPAIVCDSDPSSDSTIRLPKVGDGSYYDPYVISTVGELQGIKLNPDNYFELGNDIKACVTHSWNGGKGFEPLPYFEGSFEGKGFTVSDLYINRPDEDDIGLFSKTNTPYIHININLKNPNITGRDNVGSVVGAPGTLNGTEYRKINVENGKVEGRNYVGGIFGKPGNYVSLDYSSFTGEVKGKENIGGFIGSSENQLSINYCYFRGSVIGENNVGGVVGKVDVRNEKAGMFYMYLVANITGNTNTNYMYGSRLGSQYDTVFSNVFYDKEKTNYVTTYSGVKGLTTNEMKDYTKYSGWDFVDDWTIDPSKNDGYPTFR
ncbi:prepilin-type N-terminal cleavage/methylation domain-containing protein [Bacillus cereus]|uniref:prepilin-type N-terminal cleavage/methylation domain-containing protein n=1 Tax=Bacillus cereus TaxID=1396 RepID=UPI000BEC6E45|nr:prepilin-type N-terminal cleavage/methylation domain-containing protein [Bacillus cereus]PDY82772.1 prepilin-type cleavage/methylation domain-containing protein [Bacillus cereus]